MKFLCPNCKAKYQIADEKIGGRTLKMDCRRCSHSIVIRGDAAAAPSEPPATAAPSRTSGSRSGALPGASRRAPAPGRSGSHVGPAPARTAQRSALGADFRRSMASPPVAPTPPKVSPLDQWHVAINDVPVGPMRREEITRKIATGAITAASLAWREGLDDWRPVEELEELAPLLKQALAAPPPRPPVPSKGGIPKPGPKPSERPRGGARTSSRAGLPATRPAGGRAPARSEPVRPAARSNVVPIGGRLGAAAAPEFDDAEDGFEDDGEPTTIGSAESYGLPPAEAVIAPPSPAREPSLLPDPFPASPPAAASAAALAEPEEKKKRGIVIPVGGWIAIAGAGAFGVSLAVIVATRYLSPGAPAVAVVAPTIDTHETPTEPESPVARLELPDELTGDPVLDDTGEPVVEDTTGTTASGGTTGTRPRTTTGSSTPAAATTTGAAAATKTPSALDSRFADLADDSTGAAPLARRDAPGASGGGSSRGTGELTADQIRTVVTRQRSGLQSCYELAIRGMREVPTVRLDVDITIGASGVVTAVTARGATSSVPTLSGCMERNVRRWHFPSSGGTTQTTFPVVFQGAS